MNKRGKSLILKLFVANVLVVALGVGILSYGLDNFAHTSGPNNDIVELAIKKGQTPKQISHKLEKAGLVSSASKFYWYLRLQARMAKNLQAGYFVLHGKMTPAELVSLLQNGRKKQISVTVPEGVTKVDIAKLLARAGLSSVDKLISCFESSRTLHSCKIPKVGANGQKNMPGGIEGYLFPDTYLFDHDETANSIVKRMHKRLNEAVTKKMRTRIDELNLSLHQVLTLASIVEKETGVGKERALIASVFFNRLKRKMRLQTDPTMIYGLKDFKGNIKRRHLKIAHPYNTYKIKGLPPGPIASPGKEAIESVLWPAKSKYLYFVSKNDGSHVFCENLKCHQKAVKKWQIDYFRKKKEL